MESKKFKLTMEVKAESELLNAFENHIRGLVAGSRGEDAEFHEDQLRCLDDQRWGEEGAKEYRDDACVQEGEIERWEKESKKMSQLASDLECANGEEREPSDVELAEAEKYRRLEDEADQAAEKAREAAADLEHLADVAETIEDELAQFLMFAGAGFGASDGNFFHSWSEDYLAGKKFSLRRNAEAAGVEIKDGEDPE